VQLRTFMSAAAGCVALWGAPIGLADGASSEEYTFDIARMPITAMLNEFSKQTGLNVSLLVSDERKNLVIGPLKGRYTAETALDALLTECGLMFKRVNEETIAVTAVERVPGQQPARAGTCQQMMNLQNAYEPVALQRLTAATGAAAPARAEGEQGRGRPLEEIVVTAQMRTERLEDVPISISVLDGASLDGLTSPGIAEALNRVPGVSITTAGQSGGTQLTVRGVTAGQPLFSSSSPIGYYLDSTPFGLIKSAIVPDVAPYDLQRVEVLRGPQGTLYGASAQNGVVRVLTNDANLDEFELKARSSISSTENGGANYRADMAVNVPIVKGKLAGRLVMGYEDWSGWIDKPTGKDANDARIKNARLKLNAQPTDALSLGLTAWVSRSDQGAPPYSGDGLTSPVLIDEPIRTDYDAFGFKVGYQFSKFSVTATTSYLDYENRGELDLFAGNFATLFTGLDSKIVTQEINVTSTNDSRWRWSLGAIYREGEDRLRQLLPGFIPAPIDFYDRSESYAVFGQITRLFFDGKLELTAGLRHFEDDVTNGENVRNTGVPGEPLYRAKSSFDADSPRLVVTWHPSKRSTIYASYAEGFRSGFNQNANAASLPPLDADTLKNYEIGAKGRLWGDSISYDAAVYYIDWEDVQQTIGVLPPGSSTTVTALLNGDSASGMGAEFVVSIEPIDGLLIGAGLNWNNLEMDKDVISSDLVLFSAGDRLNLSPEYTANASISYEFPLGRFMGRFSASGNYTSKQAVHFENDGSLWVAVGDTIITSRASFAIESDDQWTAMLFVENLNNEMDAITRSGFSPVWGTYARPRTGGLQFEYRFGGR
jgi:iron complex outermembrane receptor protein